MEFLSIQSGIAVDQIRSAGEFCRLQVQRDIVLQFYEVFLRTKYRKQINQ